MPDLVYDGTAPSSIQVDQLALQNLRIAEEKEEIKQGEIKQEEIKPQEVMKEEVKQEKEKIWEQEIRPAEIPTETTDEGIFVHKSKKYKVTPKEKNILEKQSRLLPPDMFDQLLADFGLEEVN